MGYKTKKKDFAVFESECRRWVYYFGLVDWDVSYSHEYEEDCRAFCSADYTGKLATICLSTKWDYKPDKAEIRRIAFHEVCELLLACLRCLAHARFVTVDEITTANHYVIRVLENTLFDEKEEK